MVGENSVQENTGSFVDIQTDTRLYKEDGGWRVAAASRQHTQQDNTDAGSRGGAGRGVAGRHHAAEC